ncbi:MAG: SPOR domain-containing protein [Stenotrophobium sp.]
MAKDYAQRNKGGRRQTRPANNPRGRSAAGGSGMPWWLGVVLGLSVGLAIAVIVYVARPAPPLSKQGADSVAGAENDAGGKASASQTHAALGGKKNAIKLPPKEKTRFTFYDILPGQEVVVPDSVTAATGKAEPGDDGIYVIQVAAYRAQQDADAQKAKLALIGIESRIEKVTIDNKDTYYRVRVGPEHSLAKAHTLMARLQQNNVQGVLMKVK